MSTPDRISALRAAITNKPPYYSGTHVLSPDNAKLYYDLPSANGSKMASCINLLQATDAELGLLAQSCEPATFGLNHEDVLDESYRKACKMNRDKFATTFNLEESRILESVSAELLARRGRKQFLRAELYKLNVYGKGSFFKSHKDTPQSDTMLASLVVVFPVRHEGGSLILRHRDEEWIFDAATLLLDQQLPSVAYVAFYGDVDHEVSMVNEGYRVTLTYNLYLEKVQPTLPTVISPIESTFCNALSSALRDPNFLSEGGLLGFGLNFMYPIDPSTTYLATLERDLKGSDAVIKQVCERLGLDASLKAIYNPDDEAFLMLDDVVELDQHRRFENDEIIDALIEDGGERIDGSSRHSKTVTWVSSLNLNASFKAPYVHYGNEATLSHVYGSVCLMAQVKGWAERMKSC